MMCIDGIRIIILSSLFVACLNFTNGHDVTTVSQNKNITAPDHSMGLFFYLSQIANTFMIHDYSEDLKLADVSLEPPQMFNKYGYTTETHTITTEDEYILTAFRITGSDKYPAKLGKPVVMVQHGIYACSNDWLKSGVDQSFAPLLADSGFDVWLMNNRGNTFSRAHVKLSPSDKSFWDYSFHEIAIYDLPAQIDYILEITGQEKLFYVGHSQGTTAFFACMSEHPEYNDKIYKMFAYAPVAYANFGTPLFHLPIPVTDILNFVYRFYGSFETFPSGSSTTDIFVHSCLSTSPIQILCANLMFVLFGYDTSHLNKTTIPALANTVPAGASMKQVLHYAQMRKAGKFQQFDYTHKNREHYGQDAPLEYNLSNVRVPVELFYGYNDWMCTHGEYLEKLLNEVSGEITLNVVQSKSFNHLDFPYGTDAKELVYLPTIEMINSVLSKLSKNV